MTGDNFKYYSFVDKSLSAYEDSKNIKIRAKNCRKMIKMYHPSFSL